MRLHDTVNAAILAAEYDKLYRYMTAEQKTRLLPQGFE